MSANPAVVWMRQLAGGDANARRIFRRLPSNRRCKVCAVPFQGVVSLPFKIADIRPSRKNPSICTL